MAAGSCRDHGSQTLWLHRNKTYLLITYLLSRTTPDVVFFHSRTMHLDIIKVLLPTDAQENCFNP